MLRQFFALLLICSSSFAYDIPRLADITVDGDAADWKDGGLQINVLTSLGDRPATTNLDARARVAWDNQRLLMFVSVEDDIADESDNEKLLWQRDSVEIFLADKVGGKSAAQFVFMPGRQQRDTIGTQAIDRRGSTDSARTDWPPAFAMTSRWRDGGYDLEIAIPWSCLGITSKTGTACALQLIINDTDGPGTARRQLLWYPANNTSGSTKSMNAITLADKPSDPINLLATAAHADLRRHFVRIASRSPIGPIVTASLANPQSQSNDVRGTAEVIDAGGLWTAAIPIATPPLGAAPITLNITQGDAPIVAGAVLASVEVQSLTEQRLAALDRVKLSPRTFVFSDAAFPVIDFENIDRVENLVGTYKLTTRYFDADMNEATTARSPGRYGAVVAVDVPGQPTAYRYFTLCRIAKEIDADQWQPSIDLGLAELLDLPDPIDDREREDLSNAARDAFLRGNADSGWQAKLIAGLYDKPTPGMSPDAYDRDQAWWFALRKKIGQPLEYAYIDWVPKIPPGEKRPLILFLHGSGERGTDLSKLENFGPRVFGRAHPDDFPFIVVSPQCPTGEWWNPLAVKELLDKVMQKYPVDPDRVYLTGLSMGGFGSWKAGPMFADRFAAIVPICGGGDPRDVGAIADVPVWVFHGGADRTVKPALSHRMVEALRKQNGRVRYTLYPKAGHDSWTETYNDPRLYEWLLQQRRGAPAEPKFTGEPTTQPTEIR